MALPHRAGLGQGDADDPARAAAARTDERLDRETCVQYGLPE